MKTQVCISKGNSKLGNAIPNVSLRPGLDCGNVPCKAQCYALKAWRQYKQTKAAWTRNAKLARNNRDEYFDQVRSFLTRKNPTWFRWHVAGDILDQDYANSMIAIAREFPTIRFLAFTKQHKLDYSSRPSNLAIVASLWPNWGNEAEIRKSGLPIAFMQDGNETRVPSNAIECPGSCEQCSMCWHLPKMNRDVVFHKH